MRDQEPRAHERQHGGRRSAREGVGRVGPRRVGSVRRVVFVAAPVSASGLLSTGDGHEIYWEESGNPVGIPALYLHGGPGSTLGTGGYRTKFDPDEIPHHRARPARLWTLSTPRHLRRLRPGPEHDRAPGGRPRAATRAPRCGPVVGQRRLVGLDAGAGVRPGAPHACVRPGADGRHDHQSCGGRLDHRDRRRGVPRGMGPVREPRRGGRDRLRAWAGPARGGVRAAAHGVRIPRSGTQRRRRGPSGRTTTSRSGPVGSGATLGGTTRCSATGSPLS